MARITLIIGAALVLATGGTLLLLSPDPQAGPDRAARSKEAAVSGEDLLPYVKVAPPEVIERDYALMRVTPYNDPKFYFELTVPRSFENQPVKVSPKDLREDNASPVPMAEFRPTGDKSVLIEARYVRVPQKISLDRFMVVYAEQAGFKFVKRQRGDFEGRKVEDALLRIESPVHGKTLTRLTVSRRGDFIFMVAGSCPERDYPKWKQTFAVAALSFSPTGK
jgi:hypothetical protein